MTLADVAPKDPDVEPVPNCKVPALNVLLPAYVLLPVKVNLPPEAGLAVNEPLPLITPLNVAANGLRVRVLVPVVVKVCSV